MTSNVSSNRSANDVPLTELVNFFHQDASLVDGGGAYPLLPPYCALVPRSKCGTPIGWRVNEGFPLAAACLDGKITSQTVSPVAIFQRLSILSSNKIPSSNNHILTLPCL